MTEERFLSSACKIEFLPNKGWPPIAPLRDGYGASYSFLSGREALSWLATCSAGQRGCAWAYGIGWSIGKLGAPSAFLWASRNGTTTGGIRGLFGRSKNSCGFDFRRRIASQPDRFGSKQKITFDVR
jgi:hypothetical protein